MAHGEAPSTLSARPAASAFTRLLFLATAPFSIAGISGDGVADEEDRSSLSGCCLRSVYGGMDAAPLTQFPGLETAAVLALDRVLGRERKPPSSSSRSEVNTSGLLQGKGGARVNGEEALAK